MSKKRITILGGGSWGTALAQMVASSGHKTSLYARDETIVTEMNAAHTNRRYLGEITLNDKIFATTQPDQALKEADMILAAIPAQFLRQALQDLKAFIPPHAILILCAKGIERTSRYFMSQVAHDVLPTQPLAVLSGPSFATDVARGLPTAVTIAARDGALAQRLVHDLSCAYFRGYACTDLIGVEIGGALKNVLALAAGCSTGRGLGSSAQAALITRGFAELRRITVALGGKAATLVGLCVLGDLILTCSSSQSRNYAYGLHLGQGKSVENLPLAEGVATAPVAADLCERLGVEAPIIHTVASLLTNRITMGEAVEQLIQRPLKFED